MDFQRVWERVRSKVFLQVMAKDRMDSRGRSRRMEKRWSCDMSVIKQFSPLLLLLPGSSAMDLIRAGRRRRRKGGARICFAIDFCQEECGILCLSCTNYYNSLFYVYTRGVWYFFSKTTY
ncbi:hypothetical protein Hanom_Chr09g00871811 [Helianthus anomalus]